MIKSLLFLNKEVNKNLFLASSKNKSYILKNLLISIYRKKNKNLNSSYFFNMYYKELFNKGSNLQTINKLDSYSHQLYNFNKTLEINTTILNRLISKLLYNYFSISISLKKSHKGLSDSIINKNSIYPIYISKPTFKHSTSKIEIVFFYFINKFIINKNNISSMRDSNFLSANQQNINRINLNSNIDNSLVEYTNINNNNNILSSKSALSYYIPVINKLMTSLIDNTKINSLSHILSIYYKKPVIIKPIQLKYSYNNSDIFSIRINKNLKKNSKFLNKLPREIYKNLPDNFNDTLYRNYNKILLNLGEKKYNRIFKDLKI